MRDSARETRIDSYDVKRAYSCQEAAVYIGRSVSYVRALKRDNRLLAHRDGKMLVFMRDDLDLYLDSLPYA